MSVNMQDFVPWSIIYGAQNQKHQNEIVKINEEMNHVKGKLDEFRKLYINNVLRNLIDAPVTIFNMGHAIYWKPLLNICNDISDDDVDKVLENYLATTENVIMFHNELVMRCNIIKESLAHARGSVESQQN